MGYGKAVCAMALAGSLALSACQTAGNNQATGEGAIGGALIGALAGGLIGGDATGALIGAAVGGALGGAVGYAIDSEKAEYASAEDYYDAQIRQTAALNKELTKSNSALRQKVQADQRQIQKLVAEVRAGRGQKATLKASQQKLNTQLAQSQQTLAALEDAYGKQQAVLADMKENNSPKVAQQQQEIRQLQGQINDLEGMIDSMASTSATVGQYL